MSIVRKYLGDLYISARFYIAGACCIALYVLSFFLPVIYPFISLLFLGWIACILLDYGLLFFSPRPSAERIISDRLSNGDQNKVGLKIRNRMPFAVNMEIIDELPFQFQRRDFNIIRAFKAKQQKFVHYNIRPVNRGLYFFGATNIFIATKVGMLKRRYVAPLAQSVPVYPSYMQLRNYQLLARAAQVNEHGSKRMRKIGHSMEFEQIRDYVIGDDVRNVNWKATARKGGIMINNYSDERSQQVYCIIDKGRLMKMPFKGLTLLDYAINSTLVMCNVCLQKQDKIGLVTFADKMGTVVAADRKMIQREHILQALYKQTTAFYESDFEMLYTQLRQKIRQRSLIILYTNFESLNGLNRQIPYLRSVAKHHLLLVIFFENTELTKVARAEASTLEDVYVKTIAEKFSFEKRMIVKELQSYGILSVLTTPENLTINSVNKYLELKARQAL